MCDADKKLITPKGEGSMGTLYGVGIGPGDPELLTLKAVKVLKSADIIFAPKSGMKSSSIAANIISNIIEDITKVEELVFPMMKDKRKLEVFWRDAALRVYEELSYGKDAAFITIGDPFIYSTYNYLLHHVRAIDKDLKVITIPGISAINAAASLMEVPLAESDERFVVIPLPEDINELKGIFSMFATVVLLKIGKNLDGLIRLLKEEGLGDASYFISRIGTDEQYIAKGLDSLKKPSGYLSTMIIKTKSYKAG